MAKNETLSYVERIGNERNAVIRDIMNLNNGLIFEQISNGLDALAALSEICKGNIVLNNKSFVEFLKLGFDEREADPEVIAWTASRSNYSVRISIDGPSINEYVTTSNNKFSVLDGGEQVISIQLPGQVVGINSSVDGTINMMFSKGNSVSILSLTQDKYSIRIY